MLRVGHRLGQTTTGVCTGDQGRANKRKKVRAQFGVASDFHWRSGELSISEYQRSQCGGIGVDNNVGSARPAPRNRDVSATDFDVKALVSQPEFTPRVQRGLAVRREGRLERSHQGIDA
jgi:hypothetical protein